MPNLPDGWTWRQVQDLGDVQIGKQLSPSQKYGPHMRPYLRVANVYDGYIDYSDVLEMNFTPSEFETFSLKPGDILVNEGQSIDLVGRSAIFDGPPGMCFQNTLLRFRSRGGVLPKFVQAVFSRWLRNGEFSKIARQTTSIAHLGADRFASMWLPVPPLEEQRRIADILDFLDEDLKLVRKSLQKQERLRLSVAYRYISNVDAAGYPKVSLGDLSREMLLGTTARGVNSSKAPVILLKMGSLVSGGRVRTLQTEPLSLPVGEMSERLILRHSDLLLNTRNTPELVGKVGVWVDRGFRCVPDNNLMILRFGENVDPWYLGTQLTYGRPGRLIKSVARGTTSVAAVYWRDLRGITIPVPDRSSQDSFSSLLAGIDNSITRTELQIEKLTESRRGIMEDLLFGRRRVN